MTRCIADAEEKKTIVLLSKSQSFWAPYLPCDGIVHVGSNLLVGWRRPEDLKTAD